MSRRIHLCISVRGVLRWPDRKLLHDWKDCITSDDGTVVLRTASEIREFFMDHLAQGHEVIPLGKDCEGFDYKTGCPGHEIAEEDDVPRDPAATKKEKTDEDR